MLDKDTKKSTNQHRLYMIEWQNMSKNMLFSIHKDDFMKWGG